MRHKHFTARARHDIASDPAAMRRLTDRILDGFARTFRGLAAQERRDS